MKKNIDYKGLLGQENPIKRFPLLLEAALDEFSNKKFDEASLNDILKKAGISKGSFYHHFGDKFALYVCLADTMVKKKIAFFTPILAQNKDIADFFGFMKNLIRAIVEYMLADQRTVHLANRYLEDAKLWEKIIPLFEYDYSQDFGPLIESAIKAGTISSRFSPEFIAKVIEVLFTNAHKLIEKGSADAGVELIEQLLRMIQYGIAADREDI